MPTLTIVIGFGFHGLSPTLNCLGPISNGSAHGLVKRAAETVESVVAEFVIDNPCLHPDALRAFRIESPGTSPFLGLLFDCHGYPLLVYLVCFGASGDVTGRYINIHTTRCWLGKKPDGNSAYPQRGTGAVLVKSVLKPVCEPQPGSLGRFVGKHFHYSQRSCDIDVSGLC